MLFIALDRRPFFPNKEESSKGEEKRRVEEGEKKKMRKTREIHRAYEKMRAYAAAAGNSTRRAVTVALASDGEQKERGERGEGVQGVHGHVCVERRENAAYILAIPPQAAFVAIASRKEEGRMGV